MVSEIAEAIACKLQGHNICPGCGKCANCTEATGPSYDGYTQKGTHRWLADSRRKSFRCNDIFLGRSSTLKGWWFIAGTLKEVTWKTSQRK